MPSKAALWLATSSYRTSGHAAPTALWLATPSENAMNMDRSHRRCAGLDELLESGVSKTQQGRYAVHVCGVRYGTYRSRVYANQLARQIRREVKGEFDIEFITWRRYLGPAPP
jgi:hypothetical protein